MIATYSCILVDGSSYLFRAYHALPPLTNAQGMPTGAVYGVLNMLRRLLKDYQPSHIAVVFDSKSKNFRHQLYAPYKAHRQAMPDDLRVQIQPLYDTIRALGLPLIVIEGVEADDVIGTLAVRAVQKGMTVLISTGDKDLAQLVNPQVTLVNTMSQVVLDEVGVQAKFGVAPSQIIDYLALIGDSVDNIPGVPNVGPKTAANWLKQYHSLENLLKNADQIPGKAGENFRNNRDAVLLGRQLVTVNTDVDMVQRLEDLKPASPDQARLKQLFTELEFKTWLQDLHASTEPRARAHYETVFDSSVLETWVERLKASDVISIIPHTTHADAMRADLVGIAFAAQGGHAAYVPLHHNYAGAPGQLKQADVLQQLAPLFNDPQKIIAGHNLKYDLKIYARLGVTLRGALWDSLLASYILENAAARHDLNTLALKHLSINAVSYEEIAGKGAKQRPFNQLPIEKACFYGAEYADLSVRLYEKLNPQMNADAELSKLFNEIEMPLMPVLARMEQTGVLIDSLKLNQQSLNLQERMSALELEVYALSGEEFNLNSSKQLQVVLYDKLHLPILKKTPTGQPSTGEDVLQELAVQYPIPRLILNYRSLSKLKSTYTDSLPMVVHPQTGRVHTCYQQAVTSTGRLSSSDPNLQNIPIRSEEGRKIRQAFIAPPGYKILAADYSQVELRIMAHLSQDSGLLEAFSKGQDIHRATASEVYGVPLEMVSLEHRRNAKAINFGLMYGMSSFGLAQQLNISREDAQKHIDVYFKQYPHVREYMDRARALAAKQGYVKTLFGRRVQVADIKSSNQFRRQASERQAINAPLQGTAADIIKRAMLCIDLWISSHKTSARMIMQVHDELVFEVPEPEIDTVSHEVRHCMEAAANLSLPLVVDIGVGDNWDEAH